jgi:hypothetical protein
LGQTIFFTGGTGTAALVTRKKNRHSKKLCASLMHSPHSIGVLSDPRALCSFLQSRRKIIKFQKLKQQRDVNLRVFC